MATTLFAPIDGRRMMPCFDEPDMKATFKVTILRHSKYRSLSNMPIEKTSHRFVNYNTHVDFKENY